MKRILVTNDDGIHAQGIIRLVQALGAMEDVEVHVAAPAEEQSAKSQSLTYLTGIHAAETHVDGADKAWEVGGTPTDCVKFAVARLAASGLRYDHLISGINMGANLGSAIYYSGTVSAAFEGALYGVRSIALSVDSHNAENFEYICGMIPSLLEMAGTLTARTVLNVNAPDLPLWEIKGVRYAPPAPHRYGVDYTFAETESGGHQMHGRKTYTEDGLKYDYDCVAEGYAVISPLTVNRSDETALARLRGLFPHEDTLAVFIDVQEDTVPMLYGSENFTDNIRRLAACVSRLDLPAAVTEMYGRGETIEGVPGLTGRSETIVRREFSAWGSSDFVRLMDTVPARKVLIAGAETHAAVLQTALGFAERGYDVSVIEDCCASAGGHDHKVAIELMRDAGCRITTFRAAVTEALYQTNHPAAETVMNYLRNNH